VEVKLNDFHIVHLSYRTFRDECKQKLPVSQHVSLTSSILANKASSLYMFKHAQ